MRNMMVEIAVIKFHICTNVTEQFLATGLHTKIFVQQCNCIFMKFHLSPIISI